MVDKPPLPLLHEHGGQVGHVDHHEDVVEVWRHVALLQQGRAQVGALGPLGHLAGCVVIRVF